MKFPIEHRDFSMIFQCHVCFQGGEPNVSTIISELQVETGPALIPCGNSDGCLGAKVPCTQLEGGAISCDIHRVISAESLRDPEIIEISAAITRNGWP